MDVEQYSLRTSQDETIYLFDSIGRYGRITKVISFDQIVIPLSGNFEIDTLYNLGFGDYDWTTHTLDDRAKSRNGDRDKVLATVAAAALDFLDKHPDSALYATGSTPERTRLYQMGLNRYYEEISPTYQIWGRRDNQWESFEQKQNYDAFVLRKK